MSISEINQYLYKELKNCVVKSLTMAKKLSFLWQNNKCYRIERVKFGVPLEQVCKNDIPGSLLVLILKLNKEGPTKKDVFRAPGHQGSMKKLIHFLQNGRLVNIDNFSVYTIASVLKKFLRKLPGGIFGRDGEQQLFSIIQYQDTELQRDHIHRLITSLPPVTQHLLVLLFGTFRVIAMNASRAQTGMTSEALGVSVAPSFFQSCVADGKTARMEDVIRFKHSVHLLPCIEQGFTRKKSLMGYCALYNVTWTEGWDEM
ncbi:rho GTPase-activating protein 20-like isoform X7 [Portunus trituberculatus]|uniref:rho GTPase-activating protein 20-like isoform X7 n=1 Tax=Portunus trituberculatus TaxID=210409 RepID=UPI001E1D0C10|nr:rho GTPase-activating protein 20-like isoform X7 [Portunus trituberculatus]